MREVQTRIKIVFLNITSVDTNYSLAHFNSIARQPNHTFDVAFRGLIRKPEHYDVAAVELRRPTVLVVVDQFVDEDSFAIMKSRQHRCAFDFDRLNNKHDH